MSSNTTAERRKLSVPQLAKVWGVSPNKILAWVKSGELRAVNMAANASGRPRYSIDAADIAAFEQAREAGPALAAPKKPRSRTNMKIEDFV